jgi:hypothetical protein
MTAPTDPSRRPPAGWGAGPVTVRGLSGPAPTDPIFADPAASAAPAEAAAPPTDRRRLLLFGGAAGAVLVLGLVAVLVVTLRGGIDPAWDRPPAAVDVRPPLARACPAPTVVPPAEPTTPPSGGPSPSVPAGPRTVDTESGISYRAYGAPWTPWATVWRAGTLEVPYRVGQHFVTETYSGGTYHASILSAAVPAADNDALALDLECVGRQIAADVRAEYYPQPNRMEPIRDERTVLGGWPAWVTVFRLHFSVPDLAADNELAAIATIDIGRPEAAILYVSIPGTHRQFDHVVDEVLGSVTVL